MNEVIDAYMTELHKLCHEYETNEGQLDVVFKVASLVETRLVPATRKELAFTGFDGKVEEDAENDRDS